ncbi:MAG: hypothetical protein DRJ40_09355 [Thermoprotei archaeon]|nr:MAG: hypothetical protein DRJ40_09355 [Thermoprotei archaeon]
MQKAKQVKKEILHHMTHHIVHQLVHHTVHLNYQKHKYYGEDLSKVLKDLGVVAGTQDASQAVKA